MNEFNNMNQISCDIGDTTYIGLAEFVNDEEAREMHGAVHSHLHYELQVVCDGKCVVNSFDDENSVELKWGDAVLIKPNYKHFSILKSGYKKYSIHFSTKQHKQDTHKSNKTHNGNIQLDKALMAEGGMKKVNLPNAVWLMKQIYNNIDNNDVKGRLIKNAYFNLLITELLIAVCDNSDSLESQKEKEDTELNIAYSIEDYIHNNFMNQRLNIQMISDRFHIGERQINRLLIKQSGQTFTQLLREHRLNQAQRLLKDTEMSIESVANAIGYDTVVGLYAAFKKRFGITPGECRKNGDE